MFKSRTVFVIGAGASKEVGLPLGKLLASAIALMMDIEINGFEIAKGDGPLFMQVAAGHNVNTYLEAAQRLKRGLPHSDSIDEFLDVHSANEAVVRLGKAAAVKTVLEAERRSTLFFERRQMHDSIDTNRIAGSWFPALRSLLAHRDPANVFEKPSFVVFNYDRCLEYFLYYAMRDRYGLGDQDAYELLKSARIFHVYGSIGQISELGGSVMFGQQRADWARLADRIRTFTEEQNEPSKLKEIRDEISKAEVMVFLGFHFREMNLMLLGQHGDAEPKNIFGTGLGLSPQDCEAARTLLSNYLRHKALRVDPRSCTELLDDYKLTLQGL